MQELIEGRPAAMHQRPLLAALPGGNRAIHLLMVKGLVSLSLGGLPLEGGKIGKVLVWLILDTRALLLVFRAAILGLLTIAADYVMTTSVHPHVFALLLQALHILTAQAGA